MSNRAVGYTKGEIGRIRVIEDFLPPPADLVPREDNVKVTLSLSRRSLDFFKREAKKRRVPYQRMIRALVDAHAEKQTGGQQKAYIVGRVGGRRSRPDCSEQWATFASSC
jgi:predicted DNA binding CopG/RHH family protein